MTSVEDCLSKIEELGQRLEEVEEELESRRMHEDTILCHILSDRSGEVKLTKEIIWNEEDRFIKLLMEISPRRYKK